MAANGKSVQYRKSGGTVTMEFVIGDGQWARFRAYLCQPDGSKPVEFAHGVNDDNIPDIYKLPGPAAKLDKKLVAWEIAVAPLGGSNAEFYAVSVRFAQDGKPLDGGVILESGPLGNGKFISDYIKLEGK